MAIDYGRLFGMDVNDFRRYKGLPAAPGLNLRDHMTDLELALTSLAETTVAVLHRNRNSEGLKELLADVTDAGQIVAGTVSEIEKRGGRAVTYPGNHLDSTAARRDRQREMPAEPEASDDRASSESRKIPA